MFGPEDGALQLGGIHVHVCIFPDRLRAWGDWITSGLRPCGNAILIIIVE